MFSTAPNMAKQVQQRHPAFIKQTVSEIVVYEQKINVFDKQYYMLFTTAKSRDE